MTFKNINSNPTNYTSGAILGRMIDGLGFRYHWATEGLKETDLKFKPSTDGRSSRETLDHIYHLSVMIAKVVDSTISSINSKELSYTQTREETLKNFQIASLEFKKLKDLSKLKIVFKSGVEFPVWNLINGPIADAIWHTGQIVSYRRTSGNPIRKGVNMFLGTAED